jgi:prevent-host-death family protein
MSYTADVPLWRWPGRGLEPDRGASGLEPPTAGVNVMPVVGIRELSRETSKVVEGVQRTGRPTVVTRNGRLVAALVPIVEDELEDWVLANAPEFVTSLHDADEDLAAGRTTSLDVLLDDEG